MESLMNGKKFTISLSIMAALTSNVAGAMELRSDALDSYYQNSQSHYKCFHQNYSWLGNLKEEVTVIVNLEDKLFYYKTVDKDGDVSEKSYEITRYETFGDEIIIYGMYDTSSDTVGIVEEIPMYRLNTVTKEVYGDTLVSPGKYTGYSKPIQCE
jgi:hypothetical protein